MPNGKDLSSRRSHSTDIFGKNGNENIKHAIEYRRKK
jgi:hypothetical protein